MDTLQIDIYRLVSGIFILIAAGALCLLYEIWRALKKKPPLDYLLVTEVFIAFGLVTIFSYAAIRGF